MLRRPSAVALLYLAITIAMTWPVAAGLDRNLPSDLGDPAFVAGVMAWASEHWLALLRGDFDAASRFWHAPIFHPEPLTTAYSEHFALQSLLTLPVYAITRNPILSYNLAFLMTYVLAGLGMYLLVRDVIGERDRFSGAAFAAGLAFAFAPYRVATLPHLQVLSTHWMPFVLLGLHRYFRDGGTDPLVGAGAAWWAQNLSSGYYMLYFSPFVAVFALSQMWLRRAWRRVGAWRDLAVMGLVTLAATLPFALPYLERTRGTRRSPTEVIWLSADLKAWLTASPLLNVWGGLQALVKAEGLLFPGVTVVVLAVVGLWRGWRLAREVTVFAALALVLSVWLALGPQVQFDTQPLAVPALYGLLWEYVPGFNAARVPARFAMITVLSLALLAGLGLTMFNHGRRRWLMAVCGALIVMEGAAMPLPMNGTWTSAPEELVAPEPRLYPLSDGPAVFRYLRRLDERAVVVHFPFGSPEREIRYGYYAMQHGRRILNGYSGAVPPTYTLRLQALRQPLADAAAADAILTVDGATHAVVHADAFIGDQGRQIIAMLERAGWTRIAQFGANFVLER